MKRLTWNEVQFLGDAPSKARQPGPREFRTMEEYAEFRRTLHRNAVPEDRPGDCMEYDLDAESYPF